MSCRFRKTFKETAEKRVRILSIDRIIQAQGKISELGLAGAVVFHSRDLLYYTGTAQPAWLILLPHDYRLFVRSGLEFSLRETWLPKENISPERSLASAARQMFSRDGRGEKIGTELDLLSVLQARQFHAAFGRRRLVDFTPVILDQRRVKSAEEITAVKRACAAAHAGHLAALEALVPGVSELEMSAAVENAQRLAGHEGVFFMRQTDFVMGRGPLASGPNLREISGLVFSITGRGLSPAVAAGASKRRIRKADLLLVDIPPCVKGYHADQTRMYCPSKPSDRAKGLQERLRSVADHLIREMRPGQACQEVFAMAMEKAVQAGLQDSFLRFPSGKRSHFVGHGVGLELNEPPLLGKGSHEILQAGMVLALEIHLMDPEGITIKLEDTGVLREDGYHLLTISPRELSVP